MAMERDNRAPRGRKRRKVCAFCADKVEQIDYKDAAKLRRFTSERAKILPRRTTGTCAMHQRQLTEAGPSGRPAALRHRLSLKRPVCSRTWVFFAVPNPYGTRGSRRGGQEKAAPGEGAA